MSVVLEVRIDSFISEEDTLLWMSRGDLRGEAESEITAAQDQALPIKYHVTRKLQTEADKKCKLRKQFDETLEHAIAACTILLEEQYVKINYRVCAELQFNIHKKIRVN